MLSLRSAARAQPAPREHPESYPLPPWVLRGRAVLAVRVVKTAVAQALVPPSLRIASVLPGRTLAVLGAVRYGPGSTLTYHELVIAPALVYAGGRLGLWVSHICVDERASIAAGRAEWGLPKTFAQFAWDSNSGGAVQVDQPDLHVEMQAGECRVRAPAPLYAPVFGGEPHALRWTMGEGRARLGMARGAVRLAGDERLERLGFDRTNRLCCVEFDARLDAPEQIVSH